MDRLPDGGREAHLPRGLIVERLIGGGSRHYSRTVPSSTGPDLSAYAVDLRPRHRSGFVAAVALCTWDLVVFRVDAVAGGSPVFVAKASDRVPGFLQDLDDGALDADLVQMLRRPPRRMLVRAPRRRRPLRVGVEHEYVVRTVSGILDFRTVVSDLSFGVRADPMDPLAQRCPWGGVVTADGREAEIATPPVVLSPGAPATVRALADTGRSTLEAILEEMPGSDATLEGYSTHVNVSARRRGDRTLATRFASVFAVPLMLLLDRPTSPGLLVRPRPGRLELGGEYCEGEALEVALTFAVGAVLACRGLPWRQARELELDVTLVPAVERFGWFVGRSAAGVDLYGLGREAPLSRSRSGSAVTAGHQLEQTWAIARRTLAGRFGSCDLAKVDAVVAGPSPLPRPQDGVAS